MPPNGSSMCVWASMPPGITYLPVASMTVSTSPPGRRRARSDPGRQQRDDRLAVDQHVGGAAAGRAETTVPPVISVVACVGLLAGRRYGARSRRRRRGDGRGRTASRSRTSRIIVRSRSRTISSGSCASPTSPTKLPSRVDEVARAVEVVVADRASTPTRLIAPTKYSLATAAAGCSSSHRRFERPRLGGVRVEHDLGAVETEHAPALGEVPVVADVDADLADRRVEHRVAEVAGPEVELLPEPLQVRDVVLAVLAEEGPVGVDDRGGVVSTARAAPPRRSAAP